jgi:hypothetical protein
MEELSQEELEEINTSERLMALTEMLFDAILEEDEARTSFLFNYCHLVALKMKDDESEKN